MKDGGERQHLQIYYSPVYFCAIALVSGLKEEKVSAKAQVAYYSESEKKNRSRFFSENARRFKRRSKEEICLGLILGKYSFHTEISNRTSTSFHFGDLTLLPGRIAH